MDNAMTSYKNLIAILLLCLMALLKGRLTHFRPFRVEKVIIFVFLCKI